MRACLFEADGTRFFVGLVSLAMGANIIEVVAMRSNGAMVATQVQVTRTSAPAFEVIVDSTSGIAPFDVMFRVMQHEFGELAEVTFDRDDDGTTDIESAGADRYFSVRYENPGVFTTRVTLTGRSCRNDAAPCADLEYPLGPAT